MEWKHHSFHELNDPNFKSLVYQWQQDLYICCIIIIMDLALKPKERGHFIAKGSHSGKKKESNRDLVENRISWAQTSHVRHSFLLLFFSISTLFCSSGFHNLLKVTQIHLAWWQGVTLPSRKATTATKILKPEKPSCTASVAAKEQWKHSMLGSVLTPLLQMTHPYTGHVLFILVDAVPHIKVILTM